MIIEKPDVKITRRAIAFSFIILGLIASIFNKFLSEEFCMSCIGKGEFVSFLLFLFVEIIFVF